MDIRTAKTGRSDELHRPMQFLCDLACEIGLTASRRSVQEQSVRQLQQVLLRFLGVQERPEDLLGHLLLEVVHAGNRSKTLQVVHRARIPKRGLFGNPVQLGVFYMQDMQ